MSNSHSPSHATTAVNNAESQLDALIAKIHGLSGGKTPVGMCETGPSSPPPSLQPSSSHPARRPFQIADAPNPQAISPSPGQTSPPIAPPASIVTGSVSIPRVHGFQPSRDEPWRPSEPETFEKCGIPDSVIETITYRFLLSIGECDGRTVADQLKLPFRMVEPLLTRLKMEQHVAYRSSTATNDYIYVLTESGRAMARNCNMDGTYFGACPVRLRDYVASVKYQTVEGQHPKREDLLRAFSDLLINPDRKSVV